MHSIESRTEFVSRNVLLCDLKCSCNTRSDIKNSALCLRSFFHLQRCQVSATEINEEVERKTKAEISNRSLFCSTDTLGSSLSGPMGVQGRGLQQPKRAGNRRAGGKRAHTSTRHPSLLPPHLTAFIGKNPFLLHFQSPVNKNKRSSCQVSSV